MPPRTKPKTPLPEARAMILILAARAECDPRTAARAVNEGADSIKVATIRARIEREMAAIEIEHAERRRA